MFQKLLKGNVVNVFTDYMYETMFEGQAILKEFLGYGHSFSFFDESLFHKIENNVIGENGRHLPLTKKQEKNNRIYVMFDNFFNQSKLDKDAKKFKEELRKLTTKKLDSPFKMQDYISRAKCKYYGRQDRFGFLLLNFPTELIIRFFQQRYIKYWTNTIYRTVKWKVEFIPDQYSLESKWCLFNKPFVTNRKFKILYQICPKTNPQLCGIHKYTTGEDGTSPADTKHKTKKELINGSI